MSSLQSTLPIKWLTFICLATVVTVSLSLGDVVLSFYVPADRLSEFKQEYGTQATRRLTSLMTMMTQYENGTELATITEVNRFFNQLEYRTDLQTWKQKDYWASRLEFLGKGQGDCEDFAVAKFLTLIQLGVPSEKLFLTYVKAVGYAESAHLVVTYYERPGVIPLVIDNYDKRLLLATDRRDLIPVYSFTANDLYIQKQHGLGKQIHRPSLSTQRHLQAIDMEILRRSP